VLHIASTGVRNNAVALARVALPQAQDACGCGSGDRGRRNADEEHAHTHITERGPQQLSGQANLLRRGGCVSGRNMPRHLYIWVDHS
jgi:hypothetical protein